jgi:hypothetical protein
LDTTPNTAPVTEQPLGVVSFLLNLIDRLAGDDLLTRETYRHLAAPMIGHLADDIAASNPEQLQQLVAELRALAPVPTPPSRLRVGMWVGPASDENEELYGHKRCSLRVVYAASADEPCFPMPSGSDDYWPNVCGFIDLRYIDRFPWEENRSIARKAETLARSWLQERGLAHDLYSSECGTSTVESRIVDDLAFARRIIHQYSPISLGLYAGTACLARTSHWSHRIVPLRAIEIFRVFQQHQPYMPA